MTPSDAESERAAIVAMVALLRTRAEYERGAIVTMLRTVAEQWDAHHPPQQRQRPGAASNALRVAADAIERGEHHRTLRP